MRLLSMTVPTVADSDSNWTAVASTEIDSETCPTARLKSRRTDCCTLTGTLVDSLTLNPDFSTRTLYVPGSSEGKL